MANNIIEQKYIDRVLKQEANNIVNAQNRVLSRYDPSSKNLIISKRRFTVNGNNLEFVHSLQQRFIDMKRIRGRDKLSIPIHNKVFYGHFNNIINKLAFGLTDDVKELIAQEHNIKL